MLLEARSNSVSSQSEMLASQDRTTSVDSSTGFVSHDWFMKGCDYMFLCLWISAYKNALLPVGLTSSSHLLISQCALVVCLNIHCIYYLYMTGAFDLHILNKCVFCLITVEVHWCNKIGSLMIILCWWYTWP